MPKTSKPSWPSRRASSRPAVMTATPTMAPVTLLRPPTISITSVTSVQVEEEVVGQDRARLVHPQAGSDADHRHRDHQRRHLLDQRIDAHRPRREVVLACRDGEATGAALREEARDEDRQEQPQVDGRSGLEVVADAEGQSGTLARGDLGPVPGELVDHEEQCEGDHRCGHGTRLGTRAGQTEPDDDGDDQGECDRHEGCGPRVEVDVDEAERGIGDAGESCRRDRWPTSAKTYPATAPKPMWPNDKMPVLPT